MTAVLGFIGVGTITAAMVRGLRHRDTEGEIVLSPRSDAISLALARGLPNVRRLESNAAVAEAATVVVLAVRPPQLEEALDGVAFRADQLVLSCLANTPLDVIARTAAPARAGRMLPLPMVERGEGPIVFHPPHAEALALFAGLGDVIPATHEDEFRAYGAASATMSTFFALQAAGIAWLAANGSEPARAETYVRSMQRALAATAADRRGDVDRLVAEHETPGGINERLRVTLERDGWFSAYRTMLDAIGRIGGGELAPGWQGSPPGSRASEAVAPEPDSDAPAPKGSPGG